MPGVHRDNDDRFCGALTIVTGQSTVFVNNKLWAVVGDLDTHCNEGALIASYGPKNVFINGKNVICAVGDTAASDNSCETLHPSGDTNPKGHSMDVIVYGGGAGGGAGS